MAFDAFIKIDDIPGESNQSKHKGEIEVLSFSWGIKNTGASTGGGGAGAGKAQVSDFSFLKHVGGASPALFVAVCSGKHFPEAVFTARGGAAGPKGNKETFYKVTMTDVLVSQVQPMGQGDDAPTEQVNLNFAKVEIEYQDGLGGSKVSTCDFQTNESGD